MYDGFDRKIDGNFLAIFLLLIPAAMFLAFYLRNSLAFIKGKLFRVSAGLAGLGLVGFIIFAARVNSIAAREGIPGEFAKYTFWYYLSIILYIASGFVSVRCALAAQKGAGLPEVKAAVFCPTCGRRNGFNSKFCEICGAKLPEKATPPAQV
jgi:hypothetical protein